MDRFQSLVPWFFMEEDFGTENSLAIIQTTLDTFQGLGQLLGKKLGQSVFISDLWNTLITEFRWILIGCYNNKD